MQTSINPPQPDAPDIYIFKREGNQWYIHLPNYLDQGWSKGDLRMVEGAHKFLNRMSNGAKKVRLRLNTAPMAGADQLQLVQHCDMPKGGAIYLFVPARGEARSALFWICDLALFVFGTLPDQIYVQRLVNKSAPAKQAKTPMYNKVKDFFSRF